MNAQTIVNVVLAMAADGRNPEQIATVLAAMGFEAPNGNGGNKQTASNPLAAIGNNAPQAPRAANRPGNPQLMPSVAYRVIRNGNEQPGQIAQRIAAMNLPVSENAVAALLISNGPLGRRAVTERLNHASKKVTESLLHKMRTRGIIESVPTANGNGETTAQNDPLVQIMQQTPQIVEAPPVAAKRAYKRRATKRGRAAKRA